MAKEVLYAIDMKTIYTNSIVGIVLGLILSLVPVSTLVSLAIVIIGILLIASNGIRLYKKITNNEKSSNQMLLDLLGILAGFILLVSGSLVVTIIVAIYLVIEPIIELILVKFNKERVNIQAPKIVLGLVLLICGIGTFDLLFKILGVVILVGSLLYLGINYYLYKKSGVKIIK